MLGGNLVSLLYGDVSVMYCPCFQWVHVQRRKVLVVNCFVFGEIDFFFGLLLL